ncbi:MAG TPA: hypothetical protein VMT46_15930 [Anaerolineaceae bacterium]|nr:hypothetical protein [Anaerolineaceae bacterium]
MKKACKELEAEQEARSKAVIQELLDWNESHKAPDLTQIEDIVLELREKLSQAMVESVVDSQEQVQPAEVRCPQWGKVMGYEGRKSKVVGSRVGEIELEGGHYYCPSCEAGIYPPGSTTEAE